MRRTHHCIPTPKSKLTGATSRTVLKYRRTTENFVHSATILGMPLVKRIPKVDVLGVRAGLDSGRDAAFRSGLSHAMRIAAFASCGERLRPIMHSIPLGGGGSTPRYTFTPSTGA
jgi:hypothetical protein